MLFAQGRDDAPEHTLDRLPDPWIVVGAGRDRDSEVEIRDVIATSSDSC
jgi:hypothetical protein